MLSRPLLSVVIGLVFASLFSACSKSDSTTGPSQSAPTIPTFAFKGPGSNTNSAGLQAVNLYVSSLNAIPSSAAPFLGVTPVRVDNTWTWTYTYSTLTMKLTGTTQSDASVQWKVVLNGVDPADGTAFANWTALEATSSADGKTGSGKIYVRNQTVVSNDITWTTSNNVLTGTLRPYVNNNPVGQTIVVNNPDSSGELRVSIGTAMIYKAIWQANGSGQWWSYDSNGVQTGTGNWT
jgi:hypothetical protein